MVRSHRYGRPAAIALSVAALAPASARAADFEVTGDTALQFYDVTAPWGDVRLQRRRFLQTIGLGVYNLQGPYTPGKADYRVVVRMRLDADFGINVGLPPQFAGGETSYRTAGGLGARFIPGLTVAPFDMMFGYVEGRNIAGGLLGFRLGRQYMTDVLGWWSFDGALARVTTPFYVQAEVYGGLEQRGGLPLSTSRFEAQGVWRGSHTAFGLGTGKPSVVDYPSYIYAQPAPAFGFAIESTGLSFLHGRFSYRRVYNTGPRVTQPFPDPTGGFQAITGTRLSQERFGYAMDATKNDLGTIRGGVSYDVYSQIVATAYGAVEVYAGKQVTVGADFDYFVPTFDADSIWNWFTRSPITTITGRASVRFTKRFDMAASGGARLWSTEGDPTTFGADQCKYYGFASDCVGQAYIDPSTPAPTSNAMPFAREEENRSRTTTADALANVSARYRFGWGDISFRGMFEVGSRGSREGGDLSGERQFDGGRYTAGARLSLYGWNDPLRPERDAVSFGYVLAGGFKAFSFARVRVEWEHDTNRLIGQRYRVLGLVNLEMVR